MVEFLERDIKCKQSNSDDDFENLCMKLASIITMNKVNLRQIFPYCAWFDAERGALFRTFESAVPDGFFFSVAVVVFAVFIHRLYHHRGDDTPFANRYLSS